MPNLKLLRRALFALGLALACMANACHGSSPTSPSTCRCQDGTISNSCGEQGACSHHGGIG